MPDQDNSPVWVKWEKKFELGIPAIDEQHRHLVGLCNQLHSEIMSRRSPDGKAWRVALSEALRETVSYTRTHFHLEEKLMAAAGYGNLPGHKNRHQEFVDTISRTLSGFDQTNLQSALDFSKFLYEWILEHIAYEDKLYVKPVLEYLASGRRA